MTATVLWPSTPTTPLSRTASWKSLLKWAFPPCSLTKAHRSLKRSAFHQRSSTAISQTPSAALKASASTTSPRLWTGSTTVVLIQWACQAAPPFLPLACTVCVLNLAQKTIFGTPKPSWLYKKRCVKILMRRSKNTPIFPTMWCTLTPCGGCWILISAMQHRSRWMRWNRKQKLSNGSKPAPCRSALSHQKPTPVLPLP